jgi:hypothetical protein
MAKFRVDKYLSKSQQSVMYYDIYVEKQSKLGLLNYRAENYLHERSFQAVFTLKPTRPEVEVSRNKG